MSYVNNIPDTKTEFTIHFSFHSYIFPKKKIRALNFDIEMTPMSITIYNAYANEVYLNKVEQVVKIKWIYDVAHS